MSAEIDADVDEKFSVARKLVEKKMNALLAEHTFTSPWKSWDFIHMILSDADMYKEVARRSKKDMSLEFRLRTDHSACLAASPKQAIGLLLDALGRSVDKMAKMDVTEEDRKALRSALERAAREL